MPTYEYRCTSCGEHLEVVQSFDDDPLTVCPACEGALRKVFSSIGIVFKGSGFYRNDSRAAAPSQASAKGDGADTSADKSSADKSSSDKSASDGGSSDKASSGTSSSEGSAASSGSTASSEAKSA